MGRERFLLLLFPASQLNFYHHTKDFRYDRWRLKWSTRVNEKNPPWSVERVMRLQIEMV